MTLQTRAILDELAVPKDLIELEQFVLWRRELVKGRGAKVPYALDGHKASTADSRTWSTFDEALAAYRAGKRQYAGLGFVFAAGGGLVGVDLDDCLDSEGAPKVWARGVLERFSDTYMEISPGGMGVKIWARGVLPANLPGVRVGDGSIEMYDRLRYFTLTGRVFRGAPLQVEDHAADLLALFERLTERKRKVWPLQPVAGGRIPHGSQHSTLVSIAGTLRARRVCDEAILACLLLVNARQCERPGPPENIARIVQNTRTWGAR
jgi:hypothetical protein